MNSNSKLSAYAFVVIQGRVYEQMDDCYRSLCCVYHIPHETVKFLLDADRGDVAYEITTGKGCVVAFDCEVYYINEHGEGIWWITSFGDKAPYVSPYTRFGDVLHELMSNHGVTAYFQWFDSVESYIKYYEING